MPLTDAACKSAKCPEGKPRERYSDSGGLYLEVTAGGSKLWRWKYRYNGKEKRLAIGTIPRCPCSRPATCGQVFEYALAHGLVERNLAKDVRPGAAPRCPSDS
jgi:hypothetical protein